jgi:hypothetical protein
LIPTLMFYLPYRRRRWIGSIYCCPKTSNRVAVKAEQWAKREVAQKNKPACEAGLKGAGGRNRTDGQRFTNSYLVVYSVSPLSISSSKTRSSVYGSLSKSTDIHRRCCQWLLSNLSYLIHELELAQRDVPIFVCSEFCGS